MKVGSRYAMVPYCFIRRTKKMEADDGMDNISLLKENGKSRVSSVEKTTCNVVSLVSHVIHDEIEDDV